MPICRSFFEKESTFGVLPEIRILFKLTLKSVCSNLTLMFSPLPISDQADDYE